jgi:hypothetical protein
MRGGDASADALLPENGLAGGQGLRLDRVELGLGDRARVEEALRLLDLAGGSTATERM